MREHSQGRDGAFPGGERSSMGGGVYPRLPVWVILACVLFWFLPAHAQLATDDHLQDPGFWPTKDQLSLSVFAGTASCARCHAEIVRTAATTPMAMTAMPATASGALHTHPDLKFVVDKYKYDIATPPTPGSVSQYSVTDGSTTLGYPLQWAFGTGRVGQSYLFRRKDDPHFYEARVTYFTHIARLGFTPARALDHPADVHEAMYRQVPGQEAQRCFDCHATQATINGTLDEQHLVPGVHCEACHGPGAEHVANMQARSHSPQETAKPKLAIFNPATLAPTDSVEFCGSCHATLWDIRISKGHGPAVTRSAPARLVSSKCWGTGNDDRITCVACHDPHDQLQTAPTAYDHACLRCHGNNPAPHGAPAALVASKGATQKACPVATSKCASCHMPKTFVPEMNDTFTDHRIRVVKVGEAFPE